MGRHLRGGFAFTVPVVCRVVVLNVAVLHHNKILIAAVFLWMRRTAQKRYAISHQGKINVLAIFFAPFKLGGKPIKSNFFSCVGIWRNCFGC